MNMDNAYVEDNNITAANVAFYNDYGYLIAKGLLSAREVNELKKETADIFRGKRGHVEGMIEIDISEPDDEVLKKYTAIHFPHKISDVINQYLFHEGIKNVLTSVVSENVKCMQSMLFVKAPGKPGQSWHQDEFYIPTRDKSLTGAWIAIDDATVNNGCLWIIPGSQKEGYIMSRIENTSKEYADVDTIDVSSYGANEIIPVEVESGDVVFFNGYTLHSSLKNKTDDKFRMALVNHYMSAESMLPWDQDGKLPPTEDLRDVVMIAGFDPYDYKGTIDVNKPYLRPDVMRVKTNL